MPKVLKLLAATDSTASIPLLDVTLPADGRYLLRVRDLLYRGNPDSIYRLTGGVLPYNTYLFPAGGTLPSKERRPEERAEMFHGPPTPPDPNLIQCVIGGENLSKTDWQVELTANEQPGLKQIRTPYGIFPFITDAHPQTIEEDVEPQSTVDEASVQETATRSGESEILFETKCTACHELRSPSNRALSAEEWEQNDYAHGK